MKPLGPVGASAAYPAPELAAVAKFKLAIQVRRFQKGPSRPVTGSKTVNFSNRKCQAASDRDPSPRTAANFRLPLRYPDFKFNFRTGDSSQIPLCAQPRRGLVQTVTSVVRGSGREDY